MIILTDMTKNPALTTLRNKSKREAELEKGSKDNETKKTVHPSVLCGIIEDLHSTPLEKLKQNYNIDDDFLNNLGNELKIASTRIKLKDSKQVSYAIFLQSRALILIIYQ